MEYLKEVGPDTLVPCFTVNLKDNKNVEVCNSINMAIFQDLSHSSGERTARRVPMVVTSSSMLHHKHSSALKNFKKRLGVSVGPFLVEQEAKHLCYVLKCYNNTLAKSVNSIFIIMLTK